MVTTNKHMGASEKTTFLNTSRAPSTWINQGTRAWSDKDSFLLHDDDIPEPTTNHKQAKRGHRTKGLSFFNQSRFIHTHTNLNIRKCDQTAQISQNCMSNSHSCYNYTHPSLLGKGNWFYLPITLEYG